MYILKNAFISIRRNKGRNILMGIIILVIACSCAVTLSIKNAASKLIDSYSNKYDIKGSISINRESIMGNFKPGDETSKEDAKDVFSSIESLTVDEINKYGDSDFVKSYYYTYSTSLNSSNIEVASTSNNDDNGMMRKDPNNSTGSGDFTVTGYSSYDAMSEFINGTYTISDGEVSDDFNAFNCVINEELATVNDLEVGDSIILTNPNNEELTYTLKITGIYTESEDSNKNNMGMFSNSVNTIITNNTVINKMLSDDSTLENKITPTFILKNKDVIDDFEAELTEKGLSEYYSLTTNLDSIESETESISNLATFATTFLIITLVIGGVVLFIINMINVRERKYEIGVLRTIGMKKSLVTSQFIIELLSVAIISLLVGCGIGSLISVPTANALLKNEISSSSEQQTEINKNFGRDGSTVKSDSSSSDNTNKMSMPSNGVAKINQVSKINAVVNFKVLLQLLFIGIALTLASSMASMIAIARFSPITILRERS